MLGVGGEGAGASRNEKKCCLIGLIEWGYDGCWYPVDCDDQQLMYAWMIFMTIHTQMLVETRLSATRGFKIKVVVF